LAAAANGGLNPKNITALTRLDHNRALSQTAEAVGVEVSTVKNVIIWGNHSGTQVPDITYATANHIPVTQLSAANLQHFSGPFIEKVQQRGAEVMKLRGFSSAASAAKAICDHVHEWIVGTPEGTFVSMAVLSDGHHYGAPKDLMFSFPCTCKAGVWKIVEGLRVGPTIEALISKTAAELLDERSQAGLTESPFSA